MNITPEKLFVNYKVFHCGIDVDVLGKIVTNKVYKPVKSPKILLATNCDFSGRFYEFISTFYSHKMIMTSLFSFCTKISY